MTKSPFLMLFSCLLIGFTLLAADPSGVEASGAEASDAEALAFDGDDGYRLWLNYEPVRNASVKSEYLKYAAFIGRPANGEIMQSAS